LVTTCGELKPATGKTVRASSPYPPVLEPGIEEIGWLFGALKVQGLTTELGNAISPTRRYALSGGPFQLLDVRKNYALFRQHSADPPQL
jgi:hypothetical protein